VEIWESITRTTPSFSFLQRAPLLLRRKLVDIDLVDDLLSAPIKMAWGAMKDSLIEGRREWGQQTIFEWFEYLANEMKNREQTGVKTE